MRCDGLAGRGGAGRRRLLQSAWAGLLPQHTAAVNAKLLTGACSSLRDAAATHQLELWPQAGT
jgi:hypothetical protein